MRKAVLSLALLILGVATQANAALTVTVGNYQVLLGTTSVAIPVSITGPDLISQTNINVTILPMSAGSGEFGGPGTPTISYVGQNTVIANNGDVDGNFIDTTAHLFGDAGTDDWNIFVFENLANPNAPIGTGSGGAGANILINLIVDLTGFENAPGMWKIVMGVDNGNGPTDFGNLSGGIDANVIDGTVEIVPEPSSIMLGLFAATGLGVVALRKRRARRA